MILFPHVRSVVVLLVVTGYKIFGYIFNGYILLLVFVFDVIPFFIFANNNKQIRNLGDVSAECFDNCGVYFFYVCLAVVVWWSHIQL